MAAVRRTGRSVVVPAGVDAVWRALTDPRWLERWLAGAADLEARAGASGTLRDVDGSDREVEVLAAEPGRRLLFAWWPRRHGGRDLDAGSMVEITLGAEARGTRVAVTETALADQPPEPGGRALAGAPGAGAGS